MAGDNFVWGSAVEGTWNSAANWQDTTTGQNPATRPPGAQDDVTIGAAGGGATRIVGGTGHSASLNLTAPMILRGNFTTGTLVTSDSNATLEVDSGGTLAVSGDASIKNELLAKGNLSFGGDVSLTGLYSRIHASQALTIGGDLTGSGDIYATAGLTVGNVSTSSASYISVSGGSTRMGDVVNASFGLSGTATVGAISSTNTSGAQLISIYNGSLDAQSISGGGYTKIDVLQASMTVDQSVNYSRPSIRVASGSLSVLGNLTAYQVDLEILDDGSVKVDGVLRANSHYPDRFGGATIFGSLDVGSIQSSRGLDADIKAGGSVTVHGDAGGLGFKVEGTLTVVGAMSGLVHASGHGIVRAANASGSLYVDDSASIEIGNTGNAAAGAVTIDAGITTTGSAIYAPKVVDNGVIVSGNVYGALTGSGAVHVSAGSTMTVGSFGGGSTNIVTFDGDGSTLHLGGIATDSAATIDFSGTGCVLDLDNTYPSPAYAGTGTTISGFDSSDAIEVAHASITDATYADGVLTLSSNGTVFAQFNLSGDYDGDTFNVDPLGNGYTQIAIGPKWVDPVSGNFSMDSKWSTGVVPGSGDSVAISTAGTYTVALTSTVTIASLEQTATGATLAISNPSGTDTISNHLEIDGALRVDASGAGGSTLNVGGAFDNAGTVTFGNAASTATTTLGFGAVTNSGTLNLVNGSAASGAGSVIMSAASLTNSGAVNVAAGVNGTSFGFNVTDTGTTTVSSGTLVLSGATNNFSGQIGGAGQVTFAGGGATAMRNGAQLTIAGVAVSGTDSALYVVENLDYSGRFTESQGAIIAIAQGDTLTLKGTSTLAGTIANNGTLRLAGGRSTLRGATMTVGTFQIVGADVSLGSDLAYAGTFAFGSGARVALGGHALSLRGSTTFGTGEILGKAGSADTLLVQGARENLSRLTFSSWTNGEDKVTVNGTTGADRLIGSSRNDTLNGGAGNDVLSSGAGADLFVYHSGWGRDTITDFTAGTGAGHDTVQIDKKLFADYSALMAHTVDSGANAIVTSGSNAITLDQVHKADLVAADFKFV